MKNIFYAFIVLHASLLVHASSASINPDIQDALRVLEECKALSIPDSITFPLEERINSVARRTGRVSTTPSARPGIEEMIRRTIVEEATAKAQYRHDINMLRQITAQFGLTRAVLRCEYPLIYDTIMQPHGHRLIDTPTTASTTTG